MKVKDIFSTSGGNKGANNPKPSQIPRIPPKLPHKITFHSTLILVKQIATVAAPIPTLWIAKEKTFASWEATCNTFVSTGKATAPPPKLVAPATVEPKTMVRATCQFPKKWDNAKSGVSTINHVVHTPKAMEMITKRL